MTALPSIDFERIAASNSLQNEIERQLGAPNRLRRWLCPFHDDQDPSLALTPDGEHFRCWSCGERGDVTDWVAKTSRLNLVEAAKVLDPSLCLDEVQTSGGPVRDVPAFPRLAHSERRPSAPPPKAATWEGVEWQAAVDRLVDQAEDTLWGPLGRPARDWLNARGLEDHTIQRFRLGFLAERWCSDPLGVLGVDDRGKPRRIWAQRGITIPWVRPGSWYTRSSGHEDEAPEGKWVGCNVRHLHVDVFGQLPPGVDKCRCLAGSSRGFLYPHGEILPSQGCLPALVCEGEFDALLVNQEAGHLVHAATVGGAGQKPQRIALAALARCPWWLLAFDHDPAGVQAAREWMKLASHKSRRVMLSFGNDITDFHVGGGDLREWIMSEIGRLPNART